MRNSPFAVFRRNQKILMVVLTGLAMFSFIFMDVATMRSGATPPSLVVAMVALICGGGLWVVGAPRGKGSEWGLWGALLGAVVGFIAVMNRGNADVVQTAHGSFSRGDLQHLAQRRSNANRFVSMASKGRAPLFGNTDDRSLVVRALLLTEAKQRGIAVSDEGVSDFIQRISENRLSVPDFRKILRDLGLPEAELYNILREELEVQMALEMDVPARGNVQTPLAYWKAYSKLQVRQSLEAAEIPVAAFVPQVPEPKDDELIAFFEKYKNQLPTPDGQPGFLRNRQVQLAYLMADFEAFEKQVPEPTDAEVEEYYSKNKDLYRVRETPDFPGRDVTEPVNEREPASALDPANVPAMIAPQPPAPDLPESGGCGGDEPAVTTDTAVQDQPGEAPKADDGPKIPLTAPNSTSLPPGSDGPLPSAETDIPSAPEPKYRELDDDLKLQIRETILRERAFAKMAEATDRGYNEMVKLADEYLSAFEEAKRAEVVARFPDRLKKFAAENQLTYRETSPMSQQDLMVSLEEPIGQASDPTGESRMRGDNVAREAFANDAVFQPRRANSPFGDKTYAWWKTADLPAKVPAFADVKSEVIEALKFQAARTLAQKRAEELAELARQSDKPLAEALAGQTVTGAADAPAVTVKETPRFSWMNVPRTTPFQFNQGFQMPQISVVDGVRQPGDDFMRIVFEELQPGQVGVAPNQPRSELYVVRVKQRDGLAADGDDLALRALQQQFLQEGRMKAFDPQFAFLKPEYHILTRGSQNDIDSRWRDSFDKRYKIVWNENEANQKAQP